MAANEGETHRTFVEHRFTNEVQPIEPPAFDSPPKKLPTFMQLKWTKRGKRLLAQ